MRKKQKGNTAMGGRGANSGDLGGGNASSLNSEKAGDIWNYRHNENNEQFVDNINQTVKEMAESYDGLMNTINDIYMAKVKDNPTVMAFWDIDHGELGINTRYGNIEKMASAYDDCVKKGYHPGRGNKTAEQAVIAHELGHSLTSVAMQKMRSNSFDDVSKKIMKEAQNILNKGLKKKKYPGTRKIATKISEYATSSNAECIAEATADVYCNGSKAKAESKAVVQALKGFLK